MMTEKTWVKGSLSPYQLHDITRRPDWKNLIVWDAYLNNMTSGFMVIIGLAWFAGPGFFTALLPWAMTIALAIVCVDLLLLIFDLGDPFRFSNALRVMRFTSPLSVGVWGLASYATCLGAAVAIYWLSYYSAHTTGFLSPYIDLLDMLTKMFTILAFCGSIVVICYKGVAFSCTSQPGVKNARWLTSFMVSDAMLMGLGVYAILCAFLQAPEAIAYLMLPTMILIIARCIAFYLLSLDLNPRAKLTNSSTANFLVKLCVYAIGGLIAFFACLLGPFGVVIAGAIALVVGLIERYWIISTTKRI